MGALWWPIGMCSLTQVKISLTWGWWHGEKRWMAGVGDIPGQTGEGLHRPDHPSPGSQAAQYATQNHVEAFVCKKHKRN